MNEFWEGFFIGVAITLCQIGAYRLILSYAAKRRAAWRGHR